MNELHGHTRRVNGRRHRTREYVTWSNMRGRVRKHPKYAQRGIDETWDRSFKSFNDYLNSTIGEHPGKGYTLERIDNSQGYFPGNIRWATMAEQSRNRDPYDRNVRHLRRRCACGMISNPGTIARHAKMKGHHVDPTYV